MADSFQFDLVAPESAMASEAATLVVAPGVEGDFGVMAGHAPFLTTLRPGVVTATLKSGEQKFIVFGGFAEIGTDRCTILADDVHRAGSVDAQLIDDRIAEAEAALGRAVGDAVARISQRLNDLKVLKDVTGG